VERLQPEVPRARPLVGTPEGVVNARTGQRKTYFASLVHDALYQFRSDGLPLSRAQADRCFLFLMRESGFLLAPVYWAAVRVLGGLVHAATRAHRRWRGSMLRITPEIAPPPPAHAAAPAFVATPEGLVAGTPPVPRASAIAAAPVRIASVDHFVLYVADVDASIAFYSRVLGMEAVTFAGGRRALGFGVQKINLHPSGREYGPHAATPARGAGDFCLLTEVPLEAVMAHLGACGVVIEEGPVMKTGATGPIRSVYFRDPDGNLVEVSNRV
jgi:catechol 2,3-dioxygenase-like lactoylglutathione lyase family enzyme